MQKITPFLWFDNNAEEAVRFYTSVFKSSKIGKVARYGDAGPGPKGTVTSRSTRACPGTSAAASTSWRARAITSA